VTLSTDTLLQKLAALSENAAPPKRYVVAFSGGLDSTVLLHALAASAGQHGIPVVAAHVDHGLQQDSAKWRAHCESIAEAAGVDFHSERVSVDDAAGLGPEAAARAARYRALASVLQSDDWLLSAHHQDDQAETLLLNLLRGSGPAGLAGIGEIRPFAKGWLARPMLSFARSELQDYAEANGLTWIEDPSNADRRFDRNFLRHEILPNLESRWPEAAKRLQRSSRIAGDAAALMDDLAAIDAKSIATHNDRLRVDALRALPIARQRNVLRYAIRQLELPTPSAVHVQQVLDEVVAAREDAEPVVRWSGVEIRRYRNHLHLLVVDHSDAPADVAVAAGCERLELGHGLGILRFEPGAAEGLASELVAGGLALRYRHGGEKFRPLGQSHTKKLKKLLQEAGVVPWMRDRIPLLFAGDELVAVADLWLAADAASKPGVAIRWENGPPIH